MKKVKNITLFEENNSLNAVLIDENNNSFILENVQYKPSGTEFEEDSLTLNITFNSQPLKEVDENVMKKAKKVLENFKGDLNGNGCNKL